MATRIDAEPTETRYSTIAQVLHWLIAGGIVLQFVLANLVESAEDRGARFQELILMANHKSVGITVLALALLRLAWRLYCPPPAPLPMPGWQRTAAAISHWSFYALIIVIPLSGWLTSSAAAVSVSWFNLVQLPDFVSPSEDLEDLFEEAHEVLAQLLFVLAIVHIAAALKHALYDRDGALRRISSRLAIGLFVAVLLLGVFLLARPGMAAANDSDASMPEAWRIDASASHIRFTAVQAGATFDGVWQEWQAELRFDATNIDASSFDVTVRVASVETLDDERNELLMEPEWFDQQSFPEVYYRARSFQSRPDGSFRADGELTVKGQSTPVALDFTLAVDGNQYVLDGNTRLDRLALRVGTGEWEDTTWIGRYVDLRVHVVGRTG
ncbi:MAG: cytochrome b/b6 domain-containing protein [Gammaproteobacteria bacterium]|nr:cytochrome b/b6 domain-containing protein [Gammaproteobacteria bacterium]MDH4253593.1 cytochrome b/b6 domain-containing protein [Gammaproteobacteria bacterium]MDH5310178.1 cytochrome b/b6 domain-containing protein [Gammaproteobacteria bacterium]